MSLFGDINLTDWKYEDLRLTSALVPFAVIENQTREQKIADTLQKYIDILSDEVILKNKYWYTDDSGFNLQINKTDFYKFKNNNSTFGDVLDYLSSKTK